MKKTKPAAPRSSGRLGIIVSEEAPFWHSCRIITPNVLKAYRCAFKDADTFSLTASMRPSEVWRLAQRIHQARPDRLVFLDHAPHPGDLLRALGQLYGKRNLPSMYIHTYGDFTLYAGNWLECADILSRTRAQFICASEAQSGLISKFLLDPADSVRSCPFPVDRSEYFSDPSERKRWRERLGLAQGELAVIYSGRLSLQKNSIALVSEFLRFDKNHGPAKLFLAGWFDDLGVQNFGLAWKPGFYYQQWHKYVEGLSARQREKIRYLGKCDSGDLRGLYNAADLYFSLSLHQNEDFGMAPAEALCSGTPCVLSGWGGYPSFADSGAGSDGGDSVRIAPVLLSSEGTVIPSEGIQAALLAQSRLDRSPAVRRKRADSYLARFSIEGVAERLRAIHDEVLPPFQGFTWMLRQHAEDLRNPVPFPDGPKRGTFYEEIYGPYIHSGSPAEADSAEEDLEELAPTHRGPGTADWFGLQENFRNENLVFPRSPDVQAHLDRFWPASAEYYSPLNPIFLSEKMSLESLNARDVWQVRDGLVPLLWFFRAHPNPGRFKQKLLVAEALAPFVPKAWRERVGSWKLVSTLDEPLPESAPRKLILTGTLTPTALSLDWLEKRLAEIAAQLGRNELSKAEITAFFPYKEDAQMTGYRQEFYSDCILKIARHLGAHVRPMSVTELLAHERLEGHEALELNGALMYADDCIMHMMLSRGARLLATSSEPQASGSEVIPISPFHGVRVSRELPSRSGKAIDTLEAFGEAMRSEANLKFPWPEWF